MKNNNYKLVTILTSALSHEVYIVKSLLENEGIQSFIFDENIISTIGTAYVEGYKLKVNVTDLEKSKKIVEKYQTDNNL